MKDHLYPIFYSDGTCVSCGARNSIELINKFGNKTKDDTIDMYPISMMRCKECGREYLIMWDTDEDNNFNQPVPMSKNYIDLFAKVVEQSLNST